MKQTAQNTSSAPDLRTPFSSSILPPLRTVALEQEPCQASSLHSPPPPPAMVGTHCLALSSCLVNICSVNEKTKYSRNLFIWVVQRNGVCQVLKVDRDRILGSFDITLWYFQKWLFLTEVLGSERQYIFLYALTFFALKFCSYIWGCQFFSSACKQTEILLSLI